jgi:hypothetical protein
MTRDIIKVFQRIKDCPYLKKDIPEITRKCFRNNPYISPERNIEKVTKQH